MKTSVYPPYARAEEMIEGAEIGEPQVIRMNTGTGESETGWRVPLGS